MRILYLFLNPSEEKLKKILAGEIPSNHLCGFVELQRQGYDISFKDTQPRGPLRKLTGLINEKLGFNLKDLQVLLDLRNYDVIVVKGPFSTSITIACKFFKKKLVYLDSILRHPKNRLRKIIYKINLNLASGTIMYSAAQMKLCSELFKVPLCRFKLIPFAIDMPFLKCQEKTGSNSEPYILSVGQDLARDYKTLFEAVNGLEINLKIVTLPYLVKDLNFENTKIEILNNLTYEQLFRLYADALLVVVPLKKWGTEYSSGTTSLLEAKALGKAVIATCSAPMMEYLDHGNGVIYVEPENTKRLRQTIICLLENDDARIKLENNGNYFIKNKFNMDKFAVAFGTYLTNLL